MRETEHPAEERLASLQRWTETKLAQLGDVKIVDIARAPGGSSSETYLVDAEVGASARPAAWVLRIEPRARQIYENASIERQYRVIRRLSEVSDLPIPMAIAYEASTELFGAPFFLMERAPGAAAPNSYHSEGVLFDASPSTRQKMWRDAVTLLARLHRLDAASFSFLEFGDAAHRNDGVGQELARWDAYRRWAQNPALDIYDRARAWLEAHKPAPSPLGFAWGDARLSNFLFERGACMALLDWETASLGGAETDLGWWMFYDRMITDTENVSGLAGVGDGPALLALWQAHSGRAPQNMDWHLVFAGYRFALISERARALAIAAGHLPPNQWGEANPAVRLLAQILQEQ